MKFGSYYLKWRSIWLLELLHTFFSFRFERKELLLIFFGQTMYPGVILTNVQKNIRYRVSANQTYIILKTLVKLTSNLKNFNVFIVPNIKRCYNNAFLYQVFIPWTKPRYWNRDFSSIIRTKSKKSKIKMNSISRQLQ